MPAIPQVRSSAYLPFVEFLEAAGENVEQGLEGTLIPAVAHRDGELLVPVHLAHAYLQRGARKLGRGDFGILVGENMRIADLGAFGRSVCRSLTLHDALNKFPSIYSRYSSAERIWWIRKGKKAYFFHVYRQKAASGSRYAQQCALLLMRDIVRLAAGPTWQPTEIFWSGDQDASSLCEAFQEPELRRSDASGLAFPADILSAPLAWNRYRGASQIADDPNAFDVSVPSGNFIGSFKQVIATLISEGKCRLEHVAGALAMHPRTLQRHLAACEQDYSELLAEVRFEKALRMLDDPKLRLFDIALELGFEDPSNFSRSFRQWTGETPSAFREMMRVRQ